MRGFTGQVEVHQGVLEALVVRRTQWGKGHIDYLVGVRWWDNDVDVEVIPAILPDNISAEIEQDWLDWVVAARWIGLINDQWTFTARADIGGFGLDSDFTSTVSVGVYYQITETIDLDMAYKETWVDYENGSTLPMTLSPTVLYLASYSTFSRSSVLGSAPQGDR